MARFLYQVRNTRGEPASGAVVAADTQEAARMLRGDGSVIMELREQSAEAAAGERRTRASATSRGRVARDDVIFFANQLAVMVDTGVPLADALDGILDQTDSEKFKAILADVAEQVKGGVEFSTAMGRHPRVFGQLIISLVKASEATGTMGKMLQRASRYMEQQRQVVRRVKGAMAYPVAMLGFCILVVIGMLLFILPRFEKIYAAKAAALPTPTRLLLALSSGLIHYGWLVLLVLAAVTAGAVYFFRQPKGRLALDSLRLGLPVIGGLYRKSGLARCLRTLATMVNSGVGMLDALEITADVSGNAHLASTWRGLVERIKGGATLSDELGHCRLIPRNVTQMVAAGERSGKLGVVLDRVADFCEEDLDVAIRTTTSFVEPVMIVVMGALVGGIAMALLLPVFSLSKVVSH